MPNAPSSLARYVIEGAPRSGKNSQQVSLNRRSGRRFVRKSKAATDWLSAAHIQLLAQRGNREPIKGSVRVDVTLYQRADVCDLDNMVSLVYDALKGVAIEDDKKITSGYNEKLIDRARPRAEITITPTGA